MIPDYVYDFIGLLMLSIIISFMTTIIFSKEYKKYPLKLRWIWFLMSFGIRTNNLSIKAYRKGE